MVDTTDLRQMIRGLMNEMHFKPAYIAKNRWLWLLPIAAVFYCPFILSHH